MYQGNHKKLRKEGKENYKLPGEATSKSYVQNRKTSEKKKSAEQSTIEVLQG